MKRASARVNSDPDVSLLLRASVAALEADPEEAKERFRAVAAAAAPPKRLPCTNCGVRHRSRTAEECIDREMLEHTLQDRIVDRAKRRGWVVAHAGKGIAAFTAAGDPVFVTPMRKGWPDLFLLHPVWCLSLVIECKKEDNDLEPEQLEYLQMFNACGIPAVMCKPSDLRLGRVNAILAKR